MNNKCLKKSQILMLSLLLVLLIIAPLLSTSLRPTYLYFITNFLIIAVGAEAGLLSFFSKPSDAPKLHIKHTELASPDKRGTLLSKPINHTTDEKVVPECAETKANKVSVDKSTSEKIIDDPDFVDQADKVKRCASMPSLFFIGGGDQTEGDHYVDRDDEEVGEINGQELFAKAETFIGNFYKQLKMQREESWKRIHGFYQKSF
ncbi:hypothetical protein FNV43_RR03849 [Rhamnella rubrinervis]|uniref:DUF4408 domain-containing protein n=1 Tax=Rhamnella rubrinervis TaxID=2594499 RepID=A0A8K0MPH4_9ROSA|nr:hypothetical protein FNV43_RR03849 [Rhamnella rubrinervis]